MQIPLKISGQIKLIVCNSFKLKEIFPIDLSKLNEIRRERFDEYCYGSEISQNGSEISLNGSEISQNGSEISRNSEERKTGRVAEKVEEKSVSIFLRCDLLL